MRELIITFFALSFMLCWGRNDWYDKPIAIPQGITAIDSLPLGVSDADIHVRLGRTSARQQSWQLRWNQTNDSNYTYAIVTIPDKQGTDELYVAQVRVDVVDVKNNEQTPILSSQFPTNEQFISLKLIYDGYSARLYAGAKEKVDIGIVPFVATHTSQVSIVTERPMLAQRITSLYNAPAVPVISQGKLQDSKDPICGTWEYLDRDVAETKASLGGKYTLRINAIDNDVFEIVYLEGASVNPEAWSEHRVKGYLGSTMFVNNYDLRWYDANGRLLDDDNNAQLSDDGMILTLRFPVYKSQLRFTRK